MEERGGMGEIGVKEGLGVRGRREKGMDWGRREKEKDGGRFVRDWGRWEGFDR